AIAESSLYAAIAELRPGVTERHLRAAFLDRMCELGTSQFAQQGTFSVLDPGAPLRWTTTDRELRDGDLVALAGGALWAGYEGSLARTWCCGISTSPSAAQRAAFERAGGGRPTMSIAYAVGLGHEGPIAGPGMSPELERAQALEAGVVVAVRHFEADAAGGCFGEDLFLVTPGDPERLTTLGPGPLAAGD